MRLGITPSGPELLQRGELYVKVTRFSKAIPCFEQLADRGNLPLNMRLRALDHLATCYKNTSQYAKSLNTVLKLVATPKPDSLWYYEARAYVTVINVYDLVSDFEKCSHYLGRIEALLLRHNAPRKEVEDLRLTMLLYRAALHLDRKQYPEALAECKKAQRMNLKGVTKLMADMNFAYLLEFMGEPAKAEEIYRQIMQTKDEELIYNVNYENAMFNYALLLLKQKRYEESETICLHQIPNTFVTGQKNTRGVLYEVLGRALHGQGRHEEAFEKLLLSVNTLDSLRNEKHIDLSDVTQTFETRLAEIEKRQPSAGGSGINWWITAVALALILIAGIWSGVAIRRKNERRRQSSRLRQFGDVEMEHCRCESATQKELDEANRRIVSISMKKGEADSMLASVREIAEAPSTSSREKINGIRNLLKSVPVSDRNWEIFRAHFEKVHPIFFSNLSKRHPGLTQGDLKMAAFIVMNISSKEIASLLCRSQRTVESARYRLHKKLMRDDDSTPMAEYLRSFMG